MKLMKKISLGEVPEFLGIDTLDDEIQLVEALATPERDAVVLYQLVKSMQPERILEIGTFYGHTTYGFAVNSPSSEVYTLDIYREMGVSVPSYQDRELLPRNEVGRIFKERGMRITQFFGDSRKEETFSPFPAFDFIYIDGNHSLDAIIADTENAMTRLKNGGVLCWHDYKDHESVQTIEALSIVQERSGIEIRHVEGTWLALAVVPAAVVSAAAVSTAVGDS